MPSTEKTSLGLNRWLGVDKPKREDFNNDNALLDEAICALRGQIEQIGDSTGGGSGDDGQLAEELRQHIGDVERHVTAEEKAQFLSGGFVVGSYTGNGSAMRVIPLDFKPSFGLIFPAQFPFIQPASASSGHLYGAFFSQRGCSQGCAVSDSGIMVYQSDVLSNAACAKLNSSSVTYVYVVWR